MKKFKLNKEIITLAQFLKANDYISSGGEAKYFLIGNVVLVNKEECMMRGKKLYKDDIVKVLEDEYVIV